MHFSQTGFLSIKSAISHGAGWNGTFDRLAEFLLDEIVSQQPELSPAETLTQISSLSDRRFPVGKVRVRGFAVSTDGFGAGPDQSLEHPLGKGGGELHNWFYPTRAFRSMLGQDRRRE